MATAEQLKALLGSYVEGDGDRSLTVSMQVAAHAARRGNTNLAQQLRELIDEAKQQATPAQTPASVPIAPPIGELVDLFAAPYLFDEFDAIGSDGARPNEVGAIRRVLN